MGQKILHTSTCTTASRRVASSTMSAASHGDLLSGLFAGKVNAAKKSDSNPKHGVLHDRTNPIEATQAPIRHQKPVRTEHAKNMEGYALADTSEKVRSFAHVGD